MLAADFVETEIKDWLKDYTDEHMEPLTKSEIEFLVELMGRTIRAYDLYRQLVNAPDK